MSDDFVKFAFSGGVLSEKLHGRTDLEKYDLALREAKNWFIEPEGGASTRNSLAFDDYIEFAGEPVRLVNFQFNRNKGNGYQLLFQKNKLRFVQSRAYILEAAKTITAYAASTFTSVAHGFVNGDWIKLDGPTAAGGGTYVIFAAAANTFQLRKMDGTTLAADAAIIGSTAARIYTISHPYATSDLDKLNFSQDKDVIEITHLDYAPRILSRFASTNWTLTKTQFSSNANGPNSVTVTPSSVGAAGAVYAVTAVNAAGEESAVEGFGLTETSANITLVAGATIKLTWPSIAGTKFYKVYRSVIFPTGTNANFSELLGYIGTAFAPQFIDVNILADFSTQPPQKGSPFSDGAITSIDVTAAGTGYAKTTTTITASGGGTGFKAQPVVNAAGEVIAVVILNPGSGYVAPTFTFGGAGVGATATGTAGTVGGNSPACSVRFQQRRIYAGTDSFPMGVFGSQSGLPHNMETSLFPKDSDAFIQVLDDDQVTPIRAMVPFTDGLLTFTDNTVWQIRGASDTVLSGNNFLAFPVTNTGVSRVQPLAIDTEVLFISDTSRAVHSLKLGAQNGRVSTNLVSLFSSDFFSSTNVIESWTYAEDQNRLIWAQREDGTFLSCTYVPDQNVYAWTEHFTRGKVVSLSSTLENLYKRIYLAVEREIAGVTYCLLESMVRREVTSLDLSWSLDCAIASSLIKPAANITVSQASGEVIIRSDAGVFSAADIGKHLRAGGGRGTVTVYTSPQNIRAEMLYPITELAPGTDKPAPFKSGNWSVTPLYTAFSGIDHLEGETVSVLADGGQVDGVVVTGGVVTLPYPASYVVAGLPFAATLRTLPYASSNAIIENKMKRLVGAHVRLINTRDIWVGDGVSQYQLKNRAYEDLTQAPAFKRGLYNINLASSWEEDQSITIEKRSPMHATVLGFISEVELGED